MPSGAADETTKRQEDISWKTFVTGTWRIDIRYKKVLIFKNGEPGHYRMSHWGASLNRACVMAYFIEHYLPLKKHLFMKYEINNITL